jgi:Domain of unknown function (DUF4288)
VCARGACPAWSSGPSTSPLGVGGKLLLRRSPHVRNVSPHGWWVASYIERFEFRDARPSSPKARCLGWENMILVRAKTRDIAYRRALAVARSKTTRRWRRYGDPPGRLGRWVFEGLTNLLPVYEPLRHGAEIVWTDHGNLALGDIRRRVKRKRELPVFADA